MQKHKNQHVMSSTLPARTLRACVMGIALAAGAAAAPAFAQTTATQTTESTQDRLLMKDGKILVGKIISESADKIVFRLKIGTIETEVPYERSQIEKIMRSTAAVSPAVDTPSPSSTSASSGKTTSDGARASGLPQGFIEGEGTRYYIVELTGLFGADITQTPIRQALKNAKEQKADVIVFVLQNKWEAEFAKPLPDEAGSIRELFRAEEIVPVFGQEVPTMWEKPPRMVMWVKKAMGGASLLPLVFSEIYFSSDARMGGIGDLSWMNEGVGDHMVHEKLRSAFLGHAEGWAILGGHDYRIMKAMTRMEYVLSVRYNNGKPELFEGMPTNPSEECLTDSGMGSDRDSAEDHINGIGNDVLNLTDRNARMLGISKGTVDSKQELLDALGLTRGAIDVSDRSNRIMSDWKQGLERAQTNLKRLLRDLQEVRVEAPGDYDARTKARNQRRRIIREMRAILRQWEEGLTQRWLGENQIPGDLQLKYTDDTIHTDQLRDKKDD